MSAACHHPDETKMTHVRIGVTHQHFVNMVKELALHKPWKINMMLMYCHIAPESSIVKQLITKSKELGRGCNMNC